MASQVNISKALSIGGWMSKSELTWLATQAQNHKLIVEFGCFHGRSTRALADNNWMSGGKVWAVDPWDGIYFFDKATNAPINTFVLPYFERNLKDHIASGHLVVCRGYSNNFNLPHKVDMVFIDGDHRYESVKADIEKAKELLKWDGLICGHDYNHPDWLGVKEAVDSMLGPIELCDTIWHKKF